MPGVRQGKAPAMPDEKRNLKVKLQLLDLLGYCTRCYRKLFRCPAKGQMAGSSLERAQRVQVWVWHY